MATQKQTVRKQPSREKLAEFVYEYLIFIGAQNTAQSFMNEYMQPSWNKSVPSTDDNHSFLLSWWSVFWDLYSASDHKPDSPECFEVSKTLQDLVSTSLTPDLPNNEHNFFTQRPGTSLTMDSKPQSLHTLMSPNISENYTLSPTTTYPTTNSTPPTPWPVPFPLTRPDDIAVSHSHVQCTPLLSDSDMTHQKNAAIMKIKETFFAKDGTQFEDSPYPPNTFTDSTFP